VRDLPSSLALSLLLWCATSLSRIVLVLVVDEPWNAMRFQLVMEGLGFAAVSLGVIGMRELASRVTGRAAIGCAIGMSGMAIFFAADVGWTLVAFKSDFRGAWMDKAMPYVYWAASTLLVAGIAFAAWNRRMIAIVVLAVNVVLFPPPFFEDTLFGWLPQRGTAALVIHPIFSIVRIASLLVAVAVIARTAVPHHREIAASGLRTCGRALWLRVIAMVGLVVLTLMVVGLRGAGGLELLRFAMMSAAIVNIIALWQFGIGALRAARSGVIELSRVKLALAGAAMLWAGGVTFAQLPSLYQMLYGGERSSVARELAQGLPVALPLVVTGGAALLALAIGGYASQHSRETLVVEARGRGFGFVALTLTSLGIQSWLVTEAASRGSFVMLSLLAASAGLCATVLLAKLCALAADDLEREPGLPTARVASGPHA
jgi:hypothetical protein